MLQKMAGAARSNACGEGANAQSASFVSGVPESRNIPKPQAHRAHDGDRDSASRLSVDFEPMHIGDHDGKCKAAWVKT
jgi:hypothetical protein